MTLFGDGIEVDVSNRTNDFQAGVESARETLNDLFNDGFAEAGFFDQSEPFGES